jgi:hypothetical protein
VPLFWLTYRHADGRAGGVVVIDAPDVLQARFKAEVYGMDRRLDFTSGHELDKESTVQIPASMKCRFLDDGDLRELHQLLVRKNPPGLPGRRRTAAKGRAGKS